MSLINPMTSLTVFKHTSYYYGTETNKCIQSSSSVIGNMKNKHTQATCMCLASFIEKFAPQGNMIHHTFTQTFMVIIKLHLCLFIFYRLQYLDYRNKRCMLWRLIYFCGIMCRYERSGLEYMTQWSKHLFLVCCVSRKTGSWFLNVSCTLGSYNGQMCSSQVFLRPGVLFTVWLVPQKVVYLRNDGEC